MAYSGSFNITSINGDAVTEADVYFVGRKASTGLASASISGTYTGDVPSLMTAACGTGLPVVVSSFVAGSGVWSGIMTAMQAGKSLSLVATNGAASQSTPLVMANFGVGDFGIIAGQSNASGQITQNFGGSGELFPAAHLAGSVMFWYDVSVPAFKLEVPRRDYHITRAFAALSRKTNVPICIINVGIGGTNIASWSYPNGSSWKAAVATLTAAKMIGSGNVPTVIWFQGEADSGTNVTVYKNAL